MTGLSYLTTGCSEVLMKLIARTPNDSTELVDSVSIVSAVLSTFCVPSLVPRCSYFCFCGMFFFLSPGLVLLFVWSFSGSLFCSSMRFQISQFLLWVKFISIRFFPALWCIGGLYFIQMFCILRVLPIFSNVSCNVSSDGSFVSSCSMRQLSIVVSWLVCKMLIVFWSTVSRWGSNELCLFVLFAFDFGSFTWLDADWLNFCHTSQFGPFAVLSSSYRWRCGKYWWTQVMVFCKSLRTLRRNFQ